MNKMLTALIAMSTFITAFAGPVIFENGNLSGKLAGGQIAKVSESKVKGIKIEDSQGRGTTTTIIPTEHNWQAYNAIEFIMYSTRAGKDQLNIKLDSEPEKTETKGNYYRYLLKIDWTGWKSLKIPLKKIRQARNPVGWQKIDQIDILNRGWDVKPEPGMQIFISSIKLIKDEKITSVVLTDVKAQSIAAIPSKIDAQPLAPIPLKIDTPRLTPVTMGDAIIEPFFDSSLGAWKHWTINKNRTKVNTKQTWAIVNLNWQAKTPGAGPILLRKYPRNGVDLGTYSQLVLSAGLPKNTIIVLEATTDAGTFSKTIKCKRSVTDQFVLPMPKSQRLKSVKISLKAAKAGKNNMNLIWLGVRDPQQVKIAKAKWKLFVKQPLDVYLRDTPNPFDSAPIYNILTSRESFREASESACAANPLPLGIHSKIIIKQHIGGANSNLFGRREESEGQLNKLKKADGRSINLLSAATQAALVQDHKSLREVAKAAVQIALIPHWDVDFITDFPGGIWSQGAFQQSMTCYQLAVALDLSGAWLTPAGKSLILRRLIEQGLGYINYDLWRSTHRHYSNQLPVFSMGRLAVYSIMEKQPSWPHTAKPYTDLAFKELNDTIARIFNSDGGFFEGSAYLNYTLCFTLPGLAIYGNARNKPLSKLLPPLLKKTDNYIEALRSTTNNGQRMIFISSGQGGPFTGLTPSALSVLAKLSPNGAAARMLASFPQGINYELWAMPAPDLTNVDPNYYAPLTVMPVSGLAASSRKLGGKWVKLVVVGNSKGKGHYHEDRGSFVLEFAGETFAADPGGINYADAMSNSMKYAQNHNMLVPVVKGENRPAPILPYKTAVIPTATGDKTFFKANINPAPLWPKFYKKWLRSFDSPAPDEITIIDEYELKQGTGVEFRWHTPLPVKKENGRVFITSKSGVIEITPPTGCTVKIIPHRQLGNWKLATIIFTKQKKQGILKTYIRLFI